MSTTKWELMPVHLICIGVALALGFFGLILVLSDVTPGESRAAHIAVITLFFFLSGFTIGFFDPRVWWVGGLTAWACVLYGMIPILGALVNYGSTSLRTREPSSFLGDLAILSLPLLVALLGSYVGRSLNRRSAAR